MTLNEKVLHMLDKHSIGTLATIQGGKPFSRFMLFFHDGLTLYAATHKHTHKLDDMNTNPNVHILLGLEAASFTSHYCEIEAVASIEESAELRKRFWDDSLSEWMSGSDDPNYVLLAFKPERILYFEKAGSEPEELSL
jgi:general stress protein 26